MILLLEVNILGMYEPHMTNSYNKAPIYSLLDLAGNIKCGLSCWNLPSDFLFENGKPLNESKGLVSHWAPDLKQKKLVFYDSGFVTL